MRPTRRSTLGLALGGAALLGTTLGGCDLDDLTGGGDAGAGGSTTGAAAAEDPDEVVVDAVLVDLDARLAAVVAARAGFPRLREPLAALEAMHRAHRDVLDPGSAVPTTAPVPVGRTARATARTLRADEATYEQALVEAAVAADSGALARLLASMSASVAQHLAVLPAALGERT